MAESATGITFSLLLLASIIQGAKNSRLFVHETLEAEVGQNITIPCFIKDPNDHKIVDIKWIKNGGTKLAVYNPTHGHYQFWPNVTIIVKTDDENHLIGSYLHLPWVNKWDSGTYSCEMSIFILGTFVNETKLTVKDEIKLLCNASTVFEVHFGDNATIQCTANSNAQYRWTKNNKTVSEIEYLELWQMTEAHAGVYELTVNTGDKCLHKDFIISVLSTTTGLRTGHVTPSTTLTSVSVQSSPDTQSNASHLHNSSTSSNDVTELTSTQRAASDETKNESRIYRLYTDGDSSISTEGSRTAENVLESTGHPGTAPAVRAASIIIEIRRSRMWLVFIIVLLLLLIVVLVILYRRQLIKKRMDLPPPFKPPPPPVKYTAARRSETQLFPTSRCNSISEPMRPILI